MSWIDKKGLIDLLRSPGYTTDSGDPDYPRVHHVAPNTEGLGGIVMPGVFEPTGTARYRQPVNARMTDDSICLDTIRYHSILKQTTALRRLLENDGVQPQQIPLNEIQFQQDGSFSIPEQYGGGQFHNRPDAFVGRIADQPASVQAKNLWNVLRGK